MEDVIGRCRIKELRLKLGWRQRDLVAKTGLPKQTISHYETSTRRAMPLYIAVIIADALGCSPRDLYVWTFDT
jgi:transcriptional regulator with XRE-family HTH domain